MTTMRMESATAMPGGRRARPAAWALAAALALAGCTTVPVYRPTATEATTPLKVSGWGTITIRACDQTHKDDRQLDVDPRTLTTRIPAGRCLRVNAHRASSGYQVVHYCNVALAFDPMAGTTYVLNSGMVQEGKCFIELVKEDLSTETGVVPEPSARRAW